MTVVDEPILRARALLDDALVALGARHEGQAEAAGAIARVADALGNVYEALAAHTDFKRFHERREAAAAVLGRALAGLQDPTTLALPGDPVRAAAEALGLLVMSRPPPLETGYRFPPRPGVTGTNGAAPTPAPTPASFAEPRLLLLARRPLEPVVPLPPPAPAEEAPVIVAPPSPDPVADGAPVDDLAVIRARAQAALAAASRPPAPPTPKTEVAPPPPVKKPFATDAEAARTTFGEALPEATLLFEKARSFFEDLGMMSLMRLPEGGDAWRELAPVEARLLARLDGILACGLAHLPPLVHLLASRPVPDPELRWAAIFVYGSLAGDDARDQVARLVRTAELEEPTVFDAVADALFFAPHPELEGLLRGWLAGSAPAASPTLQRLAVRVLGRRRLLAANETLALAASPTLALAREGARALARSPGPLDARALQLLTGHEDEEIVAAALQAAFAHKQALGLERARALFASKGPAFAGAARWLALGGGQDVGALFLQGLARGPSPALLEAIGWFGHVGLVEPLLTVLGARAKSNAPEETEDTEDGEASKQAEVTDESDAPDELAAAAAAALFRITGAALVDDAPLPTYDADELPFTRPFEPPVVAELSADPALWSAWWKEHRGRAQPQLRYRFGAVWSPTVTLWELAEAPASPQDRLRAHLELTVRTGGEVAFDPLDFVVRQEPAIAAWRAHVQARWRPALDGTWTNIWGGR